MADRKDGHSALVYNKTTRTIDTVDLHPPITPGGGEREAEREAFERWADEKIGVPRNGVRKALADIAREAWSDALAWQAARLAPAVTLTSEEDDEWLDQLDMYASCFKGGGIGHATEWAAATIRHLTAARTVTLTSGERREIEAERSYGITLFDYDDRHKDQLCIYSNNAGGTDARHELSITQREAVRQLLFISPILARLAALPKDWDREPMPGSVRDLVRDLLRMTEKEGAK